MKPLRRPTIGIMTTKATGYIPFPEASFYAAIATEAVHEGSYVYVFFPESISFARREITGYSWAQNRWHKRRFPFPDVVYDRVFYNASYYNKNKATVARLRSCVPFLNRGLPSKWDLYNQLHTDATVRSHLPQQERYTHKQQLQQFLKQEDSIIVKPISGGFGRKVLHFIRSTPTKLEGRTHKNYFFQKKFANVTEATDFLAPKLNNRYLLQQYLPLSTPDGHPFDVRVFVQKNEEGNWAIVGQGIRLGPKHKLTSNIHGGGRAEPYSTFIEQHYPHLKGHIDAQLQTLSTLIPVVLEQTYSPLFELGIDIGIDRNGKAWVIEANAKPGRNIFVLLNDRIASQKAIRGPIDYASYVFNRGQGGVE